MQRKYAILGTVGVVALVAAAFFIGLASASGVKPQKGSPWAYVLGDGTVVAKSKDIISVTWDGSNSGTYRINLKGNVTNCAPMATLSANGTAGTVETWQATAQQIGVNTFKADGTVQDRPFYVSLNCAT